MIGWRPQVLETSVCAKYSGISGLPVIYEIILDSGETANKCKIAPLSGRADFRLFRVRGEGPLGPLSAPVLLSIDGVDLSELRVAGVQALAAVDCVWRRLPKLLARTAWVDGKQPILAKIPAGFVTAYPRVGSHFKDPDGGLATIEALFTAAALLGNWDVSLFSKYYFGRRFVDLNARLFQELGVADAGIEERLPPPAAPSRDSLSRRRNRGRVPASG